MHVMTADLLSWRSPSSSAKGRSSMLLASSCRVPRWSANPCLWTCALRPTSAAVLPENSARAGELRPDDAAASLVALCPSVDEARGGELTHCALLAPSGICAWYERAVGSSRSSVPRRPSVGNYESDTPVGLFKVAAAPRGSAHAIGQSDSGGRPQSAAQLQLRSELPAQLSVRQPVQALGTARVVAASCVATAAARLAAPPSVLSVLVNTYATCTASTSSLTDRE